MEEQHSEISGICVTTRPEQFRRVQELLRQLPGVEVYGGDATRGRLVVVQELETIDEHMAGLRRMQQLEGVLGADLVCHYRCSAPPAPSAVAPPAVAG